MRILVADDDAISRRLMERTLSQSGYQVQTAENGKQAMDALLQEDGPRLALLDWMMPELDGPEVCRLVRYRHEHRYIYITLLTSKESPQDVVAGLEAGADDYLTKPCHPEELKARLRTGQRILQLEDKLVDAREEMRYKATHDALTSLWNRAAILNLLKAELDRSRREDACLSLMLCDVDHFKQINDTHGHLVGDEVLRQASVRLTKAVRAYDAVGRYGGEEFLLVLSCCDQQQIEERAEQVRLSFASSPFLTSVGPLPITLSAGAITLRPSDSQTAVERILAIVDAALYRAKGTGRNRVICSEPVSSEETESMSVASFL